MSRRVPSGSFSTKLGCPRDVRSTPVGDLDSGHSGSAASSGLMRCSKMPYSITSSAGASEAKYCSRLRLVDGGEQTLDGYGINDCYSTIKTSIFEIDLQRARRRQPNAFRLLLHGVAEIISLLAQVSKDLLGLVADIGLHLGSLALKRCHRCVHFVETLLGPVCKEVDIALRNHLLVSMNVEWCRPMLLINTPRQAIFDVSQYQT